MRWKFVVPAGILVLIIVLFNIFFLDTIIKRTIISTGEKIFGAKVELSNVKTRFSNLSVDLSGLKVADRNDPWKNLFEAGDIRFALEPVPLLSKKFVIDEMALEGVYWGTQRKTSGELPKRTQEKLARQREKENKNTLTAKLLNSISNKAKTEFAALPAVNAAKDAEKTLNNVTLDKVVDVAGLQSIKEMEGIQADVQNKYARYDATLKGLNIDEKVKQASASVDEVSKIRIETVQDLEPARAKINALNQQREALQKTLQDVQSLRAGIQADLGTEKDMMNRLNELKDRDIKQISSKLKLPSFSLGNMSEAVFGPLWISRVESVVYYMHLARKYMPPRKKEENKIIQPRLKGMDVSFPKYSVPPAFLIKRVVLSGSTGGPGKAVAGIDFKGTVTDITSDPVLLGRPVRMDISGAQGAKKLQLNGIFDHTQPVASDLISIAYSGLDTKDFGLPKSDFVPSFDQGQASLSSSFGLKGDMLDCGLGLALSGISYSTAAAAGTMNPEVSSTLAQLWSGISTVQVNARMTGTPDNLQSTVTSNLDSLLSERIKNLYGAKLTEVNNRIRAEVDRLTKEKQQALLADYTSRRDALMKMYTDQQKVLQSQIAAAQGQVNEKQNELKGQAEREKNKAAEELRRQAEEKLKGLFR